jgi:hypothetical protein
MKVIAVTAFLLALVNASPLNITDVSSLEKRDTEMIYLANCVNAVSCCVADKHYSQIIVSFIISLGILILALLYLHIAVLCQQCRLSEWSCARLQEQMQRRHQQLC